MSQSNIEIINEEPRQETNSQTEENKFFGVSTEINTNTSDDVEVEIIDDTPEKDRRPKKSEKVESKVDNDDVDKEISDYSQRASDRIKQIKYEYHEERRAKEQSNRIADEAANRLQTILTENQRLQKMVEQGGQVLNKQAHNNALWAKQSATESYKKAYEEGDADAMVKAQELLAKATLAENQSGNVAQHVQNQVIQTMPEQVLENIQEKKLDPEMQDWSNKNPWFMGTDTQHKRMTAYAMYIDQDLTQNGVNPATQSKEYYAQVDKKMRQQFPSFFGVQATDNSEMVINEETPKRQRQTVVATATRDSGNKKPTQIRLTKTQVALARQLGITAKQYATQLLKEN
tara:strand:- start:577 stop:1611 length:1035 start_codon:yes stop_codon:yes gene_type:complete